MVNAKHLDWGLCEDLEAPAWWGARMITCVDKRGRTMLDVVWDRQSALGSQDDRAALDRRLSPSVQRFCTRVWEGKIEIPEDGSIGETTVGGVRFRFATRRSGGYLYVNARLDTEVPRG